MSNQVLKGVRIVDLSMGWAGPLSTRNLADLGASVIKVESCTNFDWWRSWEATQEWIDDDGAEKALPFLYVNRNKLDITLDLESKEGRELLLKLVASTDAVVENFSGSVLPKLRLDYSELKKANPALIMLSMPAFGATGPWKDFRAYGSTVEQSSGLPHLVGHADQSPTMQHIAYGDSIGGLNGTAALLIALWHKRQTGEGQFIDLSQVECLFPLSAPGILSQSAAKETPTRSGHNQEIDCPHGVFPVLGEDRWIFVHIKTDQEWQIFSSLVDELSDFNRLTLFERQSMSDKIFTSIADWSSQQDGQVLMKMLQQNGIAAATLNNSDDLIENEHFQSRGYLQWLERAFVGNQPHPSPPWRNGTEAIKIKEPAPTLGQHNTEILKDWLGLNEAELSGLEKRGIIGNKPRL